ncbi:hypothetical protein MMC07_001222 [Pseudocyphellaria aurata]|nr:hypothetical protein [Pseudocyphellaria aurata]
MLLRLFSSSGPLAFFSFAALYVVTILYVQLESYRDPTSLFFNPRRAYVPAYSTIRQQEAEAFVAASTNNFTSPAGKPIDSFPMDSKTLCMGIASVARKGARYFRTTVGSLLEGLTAKEREEIYLLPFIAHTHPAEHPAYSETWLRNLSDEVLYYNQSHQIMTNAVRLEHEGLIREKGLFDYTYLLKACYAKGLPYIAMLEDDVVAMDGWYHRTIAALEQAEIRSALERASGDFLYLRLFYTEEFLGWNREYWPSYVFWSTMWTIGPAVVFAGARFYFPPLKQLLSNRVILSMCGICIPLLIGLFFATGKVTMLPLPAGINEMNNYGCCSQGLVFPRDKVLDLIDWYEMKNVGFVDRLTEEYADQHGELRWALTPSVIQHVGRKSSKGDDFGVDSKYHRSVAEKLWNFAFEQNSATDLRTEHSRAVSMRQQNQGARPYEFHNIT